MQPTCPTCNQEIQNWNWNLQNHRPWRRGAVYSWRRGAVAPWRRGALAPQDRRKADAGPTQGRRRADARPTHCRRRADAGPTQGRRKANAGPTQCRRRADAANQPARHKRKTKKNTNKNKHTETTIVTAKQCLWYLHCLLATHSLHKRNFNEEPLGPQRNQCLQETKHDLKQ